jgi:hypothetical protein
MEKFFSEVKLDEYEFNLKIFVFLLYLTDIAYRLSDNESIFIINFFEKEIEPLNELKNVNNSEELIKFNKKTKFPKTSGIKKIDEKSFLIYNQFYNIKFEGKNYIIENLIEDYKNNSSIPLEILLLRNVSLQYFKDSNENFLNIKDNLFKKFISYVKLFIKSECIKEAL